MRLIVLPLLLLVMTAPPALAQEWQRLGAGPVLSDEERWLTLDEGSRYRGYDTRLHAWGPAIPARPGCPLSVLGRARGLMRCHDEPRHLVRSFHVVDLATGAVRKLRRKGNRKGLRVDSLTDLGEHWAGGLSCGSNGQRTCPQVYVNLRTGRRLRIADLERRDLDSPRLRVIRTPPAVEIVRTGPPSFELLLRRPGRPDALLRSCQGSLECMHFNLASGVAFWFGDDGALNAFDARSDGRHTLVAPDGTTRPVATATDHALVLTGTGGVHIRAR